MDNRNGREHKGSEQTVPTEAVTCQGGEVRGCSSMIELSHERVPDLSMAFSHGNLVNAAVKLKRKKTTPGIDGVAPQAYYNRVIDCERERDRICDSVVSGSYKVVPNRSVEIAKSNGKTRTLSVPTAKDRLIQRVSADSLYPLLSSRFHRNSFAYQRGKSQRDAISTAVEMTRQNSWVVKVDLKAFFDTLNRERLLYLLGSYSVDMEWQKLIRKFIYNHRVDRGQDVWRTQGIGQGGPLSPLLANTYLTPLDHLLEAMNIPFVRYADDILLFAKTQREGFLVLGAVGRCCDKVIKVSFNPEKSYVRESEGVSFLGLSVRASGAELPVETLRRYLDDLSAFVATRSTADLTANRIEHSIISKIQGKAEYYKLAVNYGTNGLPLLIDYIHRLENSLIGRSACDLRYSMPNRAWIERRTMEMIAHISFGESYEPG